MHDIFNSIGCFFALKINTVLFNKLSRYESLRTAVLNQKFTGSWKKAGGIYTLSRKMTSVRKRYCALGLGLELGLVLG